MSPSLLCVCRRAALLFNCKSRNIVNICKTALKKRTLCALGWMMRHQSQASTFVMRRTHCQIHWIHPVPCTLYSQYRLVPSWHAFPWTRPRHAKGIAALKFKRFDFSSTFSCFSCVFFFVGVFYFWFSFLLLLFVISVFPQLPQGDADKSFFLFSVLTWTENGSFAFLFTCNIF